MSYSHLLVKQIIVYYLVLFQIRIFDLSTQNLFHGIAHKMIKIKVELYTVTSY